MYIIYSRGPVTMFLQPAAESRLTNARERREVLVDYNMHSIHTYIRYDDTLKIIICAYIMSVNILF